MEHLPDDIIKSIVSYLPKVYQIMLKRSRVVGKKFKVTGEIMLEDSLSSAPIALEMYPGLLHRPRVLSFVACGGHIPLYTYVSERVPDDGARPSSLCNAAKHGHYSLFMFLIGADRRIPLDVSFWAGYGGNETIIDIVLKKLVLDLPHQRMEEGDGSHIRISALCKGAARAGRIDILERYFDKLEHTGIEELYRDIWMNAPYHVLQWTEGRPFHRIIMRGVSFPPATIYWLCHTGRVLQIDILSLLQEGRYRCARVAIDHRIMIGMFSPNTGVFLVRRNKNNLDWSRDMISLGFIPGPSAITQACEQRSIDHLSMFLRCFPQGMDTALMRAIGEDWLEGTKYILKRYPGRLPENINFSSAKGYRVREWLSTHGTDRWVSR